MKKNLQFHFAEQRFENNRLKKIFCKTMIFTNNWFVYLADWIAIFFSSIFVLLRIQLNGNLNAFNCVHENR